MLGRVRRILLFVSLALVAISLPWAGPATAQSCGQTNAQQLFAGSPLSGYFCRDGKIDTYYFDVNAGDTDTLTMTQTATLATTPTTAAIAPRLELWTCCDNTGHYVTSANGGYAVPASLTYTFSSPARWAVRAESVSGVGAGPYIINLSVSPAQSGGYDSADLGTQSPYPTINAGDSIHIYITPHNSGSTTWSAQNGYGYVGKDGWSYYGQRLLWRDVLPGGSITFEDTVTPPATPGTYNYGFLLTHNGTTFGPYFYIPVTVVGSVPPAPPPPSSSYLGGMAHMDGYCQSRGFDHGAVLNRIWYCVNGGNWSSQHGNDSPGYSNAQIDMNDACAWHYPNVNNPMARQSDSQNPFSWFCVSSS